MLILYIPKIVGKLEAEALDGPTRKGRKLIMASQSERPVASIFAPQSPVNGVSGGDFATQKQAPKLNGARNATVIRKHASFLFSLESFSFCAHQKDSSVGVH